MNAGTDHPPLDDPKDNELTSTPEPVCEECGMSMDDEEARMYGGHSEDCQRVWIVTDWNEEIPR